MKVWKVRVGSGAEINTSNGRTIKERAMQVITDRQTHMLTHTHTFLEQHFSQGYKWCTPTEHRKGQSCPQCWCQSQAFFIQTWRWEGPAFLPVPHVCLLPWNFQLPKLTRWAEIRFSLPIQENYRNKQPLCGMLTSLFNYSVHHS